MNDSRKKKGSNKNILLLAVSIIIVIIIFLSILYIWFESNIESDKKNIEDSEKPNDNEDGEKLNALEFSINMENILPAENISVDWQLINAGDNNITCTDPHLGKTLDFYITAENGTVYNYVGPVDTGLPIWKKILSGEVINGTIPEVFFRNHSFYTGENYSHWQNGTTDEYWFFQPGAYEIYGEYISLEEIIGVLYSNTITFRIE